MCVHVLGRLVEEAPWLVLLLSIGSVELSMLDYKMLQIL